METFNVVLSPFFQWLLKTTVQGSILICLIFLIKVVLRQKLPVRWHYYLWLILLVRLALPWSPQSSISIFNLMPQIGQTTVPVVVNADSSHIVEYQSPGSIDTEEMLQVSREETRTTGGESVLSPISQTSSESGITEAGELSTIPTEQESTLMPYISGILPIVWLIGALALACYISLRNIILWRAIKRERQVTDQEILNLLEDCKMQMQVQTVVGIVVTDKVKSPALFGFVRPRLLLPQGLIESINLDELQYVFLHELAHLRRRDIYLGWAVSLLQVLHWFNPLIWFAFRRMRTDQELACDALALSKMSAEEPPRYGRTLVNLFERFSQVTYVPSIAGILEDKSQLERRIKMITLFKKNSYQWSSLAVILIIIIGCVSLPDGISTKASVEQLEPATTLRRLPYTWGDYTSLSPDGRYMCYVDWDIDWETESEKLVLRELATDEVRVLPTTGHPEYSAISPTGTQIASICHDPNWENPGLYTIGVDGTDHRCIRDGDCLIPKDWSADGTRILALEYDKDPKQLVWVSVVDGSLDPIVSVDRYYIQGEGHPGKFDVSPDGRFIAYDCLQPNSATNHDLAIFDLKKNRETAIASHPADEKLLGWTPDGGSIFFASDRGGTWDGWLQHVTNGVSEGFPELIRKNIGDIIPIGLTQGEAFYYHTGNKPVRDVFVATLDFEKGQVLTSPMPVCQTGASNFPTWSPDGRELAYCTGRPGEQKILHIRNLANGQEREIDTGLLVFAFPSWSADGRSIVGSAANAQPYGIYKIDVETGERTELVRSATEPSWQGALFSDGQALLCSRGDPNSGGLHYLVRNLTTGREESLIQTADPLRLGSFALSPDEQWLAYTTSIRGTQVESLKVVPSEGGEPRTLVQFDESDRMWLGRVTWIPDSQRVLFVKRLMDDKGHELWQIPVQGGEPQKVWTWETPLVSFSVHPDGQRIAFHTRTSMNEMWVMENFLPESVGEASE